MYWAYATTRELLTITGLYHLLKWFLVFFTFYAFYWINHYILVDKIFKARGIFYYLISFVGLAMIFWPIIAFVIKFVHFQWYYLAASEWIPAGERTTKFQVYPANYPWIVMFISIPMIVIYQWWKQQNDITQLEKAKSTAELNSLKQQINPHFLFNTLNSLYALGLSLIHI